MVRLWLLIGAVLISLSNGAAAQGAPPAPAAPAQNPADVYKLLLDNAKVRVLQATFKPGTKAPPREFLNHVIYMQTGGTLVFEQAGHTGYEMTFKAGDAQWFPAQTRTMENDTDQEVRLLIVEVKEGIVVIGKKTKVRGKRKPKPKTKPKPKG
jgi:hypothetical protein